MRSAKFLPFSAALLVAALIFFTGCTGPFGGSRPGVQKQPEAGAKEEDRLVFWSLQQADINIKDAQKSAVKDFETANRCSIELTTFPYVALRDNMLVAVASGQGPDILSIDQIWVPQYAASGFILPLDTYLNNSPIDAEQYFKGAWEAGRYLGKTYAIPFDVGVWALLYYNKDIFKEEGLDPEKPPQTWSEFLRIGKILSKDGRYGMAAFAGTEPAQCLMDAFTFSAGGKIIDDRGKKALLNSEAGIRAMNFYKACTEISPPGSVARSEEDSFKLFTSGQVAMFFYGEWGQETIQTRAPAMNYGVALLPRPEGGKSVGTFGGYNLGINSNCRNVDLAWEFIRFATGKEVEMKITMLTPAHKEAAMEYLKKKRKYPEVVYEQLSNSSFRPAVRNYTEISEIQGKALEKVLLNQMTTQDALDEAATKIDELLGSLGGDQP